MADYAEKNELTVEEANDKLSKSMTWIGIIYFSSTGLVWAIFIIGFLYRKSTLSRTDDFEERMILEDRRADKKRRESEIKAKHEKLRQDMEQQYPDFKKYNDNAKNTK